MKIGTIIVFSIMLTVGSLIWFSGWGSFFWFMGTKALPEDVGFGYYRDFHIARTQLECSPCAQSIEYSRHEDFTLEDFHFQIRTPSGSFARLWFYEGMDVESVCLKPAGLVVIRPGGKFLSQEYSPDGLSRYLADKSAVNLSNVLCNLDELAKVFESNYDNVDISRFTYKGDQKFKCYLHIEILGREPADDYSYATIR